MPTQILSFSPDEAYPGQSVEVRTEELSERAEGFPSIQGALWVSEEEGLEERSPEAIVEDIDTYTLFSVAIPETLEPGKYGLIMYVSIGDLFVTYESQGVTLTVTASGGGEDRAYITRIVPSRVRLAELNNVRFRVSGQSLDQVNLWSIAPPSDIRLVRTDAGDMDMVTLRPTMVPEGIQPGRYRLKGLTDEGRILSPVAITLE